MNATNHQLTPADTLSIKALNIELAAALDGLVKKYETMARDYADAADLGFHAASTPCIADLPDTGPMMQRGRKRHADNRSHFGPRFALHERAVLAIYIRTAGVED